MGGRGGGSPATRAQSAPTATAVLSPTDQIRAAYADLQRTPGDWVPLADLRERLAAMGMSRQEQDAALLAIGVTRGVHLITWDNRQALRQRDHDAALRFGGDDNHAIRIEN